jgi:predicted nucleotidyltransferase
MRRPPVLNALFPGTRADILAACMLQSEKWWFLTELAKLLGTSVSSLQREIGSLVSAEILQRRRDGTRVYVRANPDAPVFPDLKCLFEKTSGIVPVLEMLLKPFRERIPCAFVYGSVAKRSEHALSDIDFMVIGSIGLADVSTPVRRSERYLGREVNVAIFSPREFREKAKSGDHFVNGVLRGPKEFVVGNENDLDAVVGQPRRAKAPHLKARTRQPT